MGEHNYLGIGLYTIPEAARIVHVSPARLRRWLQGYKFQGRSAEPVLHRELPELEEHGVVTFLDLVGLILVSHFRSKGVSLQAIRENARIASERLHTDHPFAVKRFHLLGKELIAETVARDTAHGPRRLYEDLRKSQLILDQVAESFFGNLHYEGDLARQYWPLGKDRRVVLDPTRAFGQPADPTTGVPTHVLYGMYKAGESAEDVARSFHVDLEAVHSAIEYEQSLAQAA